MAFTHGRPGPTVRAQPAITVRPSAGSRSAGPAAATPAVKEGWEGENRRSAGLPPRSSGGARTAFQAPRTVPAQFSGRAAAGRVRRRPGPSAHLTNQRTPFTVFADAPPAGRRRRSPASRSVHAGCLVVNAYGRPPVPGRRSPALVPSGVVNVPTKSSCTKRPAWRMTSQQTSDKRRIGKTTT